MEVLAGPGTGGLELAVLARGELGFLVGCRRARGGKGDAALVGV